MLLALLLAIALPVRAPPLMPEDPAPESIHASESRAHPYDPRTMETPLRGVAPESQRPDRIVYGYLPYWTEDTAQLRWDTLTHLAYFSLDLGSDGRVTTSTAARLTRPRFQQLRTDAAAHGVKLVLTFTSFDRTVIPGLVGTRRTQTIDTIVTTVKSAGAQGANVDFELPPASARADYATFMAELATRLHAEVPGSHVTFAGPAIDWTGAFDYARLLADTDGVMLMAYDCHWRTAPTAGPVSPLAPSTFWGRCSVEDSVDAILAKSAHPEKILAGLPWYGFEYPTTTLDPKSPTRGAGKSRFVSVCAATYARDRRWDEDSQTPFTAFTQAGANFQLWCDDLDSFERKLALLSRKRLGGLGIWALGYEGSGPDWWDTIRAHLIDPDVPDAGTPVDAGPVDAGPDPSDAGEAPADGGYPDDIVKPGNAAPVAVLVPPRGAAVGLEVVLDGSNSFDPDGDDLLHRWTQEAGAPLTLVVGDGLASFIPAEPGTYRFGLVVSDGGRSSAKSIVVVEVADEGGGGGDAGGCGCGATEASALALLALAARRRR